VLIDNMKKIKILFYSHTIDYAGTWRSHERILLSLNKEKFDVYVFYNPNQNNNRLDFLRTKLDNNKIIPFFASLEKLGPKMAYSEQVLKHDENPSNVGKMDATDTTVGTGLVGAPACGDVLRLQIKVEDGIITDARFKTYGCGSAIASSSLVTELVKGMTLDQATGIKNTQLAEELALPPVKIHCSILAEDAIKAAVEDYRKKHQ
jgi:nitrogen fixation NifU-like protein